MSEKLSGNQRTSLLWLRCPKSHNHNYHKQNHSQALEHRKHGHKRALKIDVWIYLKIKETLTGALKPTEGVLSMLRVDKSPLTVGASVDARKKSKYCIGTTQTTCKKVLFYGTVPFR